MSAVVSSQKPPAAAGGHVHPEGTILHMPAEVEASEQKRWLIWFGLPALVAAVFVGLLFGTGQEAFIGLAAASIVTDIGILIWLTLSSDTNAALAVSPH